MPAAALEFAPVMVSALLALDVFAASSALASASAPLFVSLPIAAASLLAIMLSLSCMPKTDDAVLAKS